MIALRHVPVGRSGLLWLRHRLEVTRHGSSVLRRKLTLLAAEHDRLRRRRAETARDWAAADATAHGRLERAMLLDGLEAIEAAADEDDRRCPTCRSRRPRARMAGTGRAHSSEHRGQRHHGLEATMTYRVARPGRGAMTSAASPP
ncbi:hypothetical protein ABT369_10195 [Dactylosporangium sp. NPDC000244]|uniref:hypothetical protein n=1 Tax=Dactylosporangium sp. NPDC000244 TaxID=3154365 RepID=UPI003331CBDC